MRAPTGLTESACAPDSCESQTHTAWRYLASLFNHCGARRTTWRRRIAPTRIRFDSLAAASAVCLGLCAAWPSFAHAGRHYRARFEAEALDLEPPGAMEIDHQVGAFYSDDADGSRATFPDGSIDLGVFSWLELDLDYAFSVTHLDGGEPRLVGEPLWLAAQVSPLELRDDADDRRFGVGLQVGPRLASLGTPAGIGFGALALVGVGIHGLQLSANLGAFFDRGQPAALMSGIDAQYAVGSRWTMLADVTFAYYAGPVPEQLILDLGAAYKVNEQLLISFLLLGGPAFHGDRAGALLGVTYAMQAWGQADP